MTQRNQRDDEAPAEQGPHSEPAGADPAGGGETGSVSVGNYGFPSVLWRGIGERPPPVLSRIRWRSPLRGPWLTSVFGAVLLVALPVVVRVAGGCLRSETRRPRLTAARSVVQEGHQHVFGAVILQGIHPQPVDHAAVRPLYATAGRADVASDVGVGQQPQDRRHLSGVKVGQLCPSAGPHTVVDAPGGNQNMMPSREGSGSGRDGELIIVSGIGQAWSSSD